MYNNKIVQQIVAVNNKGFIGKDGNLMWRNKEDLEHFKEVTMWNALVVGRKTLDTLPKVVNEGRILIPVSRSGNSVEEALNIASEKANKNTIFVIGGAEIYRETEKYTDFIILSRINDDQEGDATFEIPTGFVLEMTEEYETFTLEIYAREESELNLFLLANDSPNQAQANPDFEYNLEVDIVFDPKTEE